MTRKIFALLLALFLSLAACVAAAEETGGEYTVLGETGIRVRLAPGLEKQELTEEDIESGVIGYYTNLFAEGTEGKYVTVMYYPEEIITAEERLEECKREGWMPTMIDPRDEAYLFMPYGDEYYGRISTYISRNHRIFYGLD